MKFEKHCQHCEELLGNPFPEVHRWLDALAHKPAEDVRNFDPDVEFVYFNPYHRAYRHNKKGIEAIREMWGDEAAHAAEIHIIDDMFDGKLEKINEIPLDENDFLKKGFC